MNKRGRPLKVKSVNQLEKEIEGFFKECKQKKVIPTICGLAVYCGMDRRTLLNYSKKEEYFPTIKKARDRIEAIIEQLLFTSRNVAGVIFNLKNNFDWKDRQDLDVTSGNRPIPILNVSKNISNKKDSET